MCVRPIRVKIKGTGNVMSMVPCGKCPKCLQDRANSWVQRLLKEERSHSTALFITLTYEQPPMTKNGFMTLDKTDYQKFMKRLRKLSGCKTIRYYACGEYGTETQRPHYHAVIFDVSQEQVISAWDKYGNGLGHTFFGDVKGESIAYVTKYICKGQDRKYYRNDDRMKEFSLMSKNMGINYLTPEMVSWHKQNEASYMVLDGGQKHRLPRYYRDRIFSEEEKQKINYTLNLRKIDEFDAAVKKAGSLNEYYRVRLEAVHRYELNMKNRYNKKRNKL